MNAVDSSSGYEIIYKKANSTTGSNVFHRDGEDYMYNSDDGKNNKNDKLATLGLNFNNSGNSHLSDPFNSYNVYQSNITNAKSTLKWKEIKAIEITFDPITVTRNTENTISFFVTLTQEPSYTTKTYEQVRDDAKHWYKDMNGTPATYSITTNGQALQTITFKVSHDFASKYSKTDTFDINDLYFYNTSSNDVTQVPNPDITNVFRKAIRYIKVIYK